jgi:Ca2+-transporting ATPase
MAREVRVNKPTGASPPAEENRWHTLVVREVADRLQSDVERGLSAAEAKDRLARYGPNTLAAGTERSIWSVLASQFASLIVGLLAAAAAVAFVLGDQVEALAILVVILLNAAIGFLTEWRASRALSALRRQVVARSRVVRDGRETRVASGDLVPGDLVVLSAGERVPADGRVVEAVRLQLDEAPLTGESVPVAKTADPVADPDALPADRACMAFLGTTVTDGRGLMLVTGTGAQTEVGRIGRLTEEATGGETPLERKLNQLGRTLVVVVLALCAVIVLAGWARGIAGLTMLEVGLSLAIAAVPEGLTAVTTMTLALGVRRMARQRALVRRLPAVETLGATTVICSDKTGTLTRNEMTVQALQLGPRRVEVTGSGLDPRSDEHLALALRIGALSSDARIDPSGVTGDPTEVALVALAARAGLNKDELELEVPRVGEVPFQSETRRMMTVHRSADGRTRAYLKGAPSAIREVADQMLTPDGVQPFTANDARQLLEWNDELAGRALRVLALGYKDLPDRWGDADLQGGFVVVGLVGMADPLRDEARSAVTACHEAGIRVVMMTGDQQATAAEIGRQLGLDRDPTGKPLRTIHGRELAGLDAEGWRRLAAAAGVFARVSPEHKLRIVEALQADGEIVAMTGDGVNDAPALRKADIGVAMGLKGTEVAKEAAAMVLTDDNFATLVAAVEQGRIIYANILRFVHYLFSCNLSEILVVFVALMIGWPLPLAPLQVLWLNLVTDVFPALALALERASPDAMKRPPRDPRQPLLHREFVGQIVFQGAFLAAVTLAAFWVGMHWYGTTGDGLRHAVTLSFMTLALTQVVHAFNVRSQRRTAFDRRLFTNRWLWAAIGGCIGLQLAAVYWPFLRDLLHTTPLNAADWGLVAGCSLAPILVVELVKAIRRA